MYYIKNESTQNVHIKALPTQGSKSAFASQRGVGPGGLHERFFYRRYRMNNEELITLIKELDELGYSVEKFSQKNEYPQEIITLKLIRCSV
jgi:hypothetical protein